MTLFTISLISSFAFGIVVLYPLLRFLLEKRDRLEMNLKRFNFGVGYDAAYYILFAGILSTALSNVVSPIYEPVYISTYSVASSISLWVLMGLMIGFFVSRLFAFTLFILARREGDIKAFKDTEGNRIIFVRDSL